MSVIVILSDCPPKLRGDMTKWFFEINTGVYVGNVSARVRDHIWERITSNIGRGHATMVYSSSGEQRMDFRVHNAYWEPVDFDGVKIMRRPDHRDISSLSNKEKYQSNASKKQFQRLRSNNSNEFQRYLCPNYVVLDFETTGLDSETDEIMEIGAILIAQGKEFERYHSYVKISKELPQAITSLTGITAKDLEENGKECNQAILELIDFVEDLPLVCHNARFEQAFLEKICASLKIKPRNRYIDTMELAKKLIPELENYKLTTISDNLGIAYTTTHRAMSDCEITLAVYNKLKEMISQ